MFCTDGGENAAKCQWNDEDQASLASWALVSDKDTASQAADWFMVDESDEPGEQGCDECGDGGDEVCPEKVLERLVGPLSVGPLTINGIDFSQIGFLLGEWIDSLGHSVSVVATGGGGGRARISWDHKGQKKTPWRVQCTGTDFLGSQGAEEDAAVENIPESCLYETLRFLFIVYREEGGSWICGNGQLLSAATGRVQWQRDDGSCTEWIRTLPASAAFLSAYIKPISPVSNLPKVAPVANQCESV
eukprot:Skav218606  [mRNA]  locus=scaffold3208:29688:30664:+ [translate_table: standard]